MKKLLLFQTVLLVFLSVSFVACSDDDDEHGIGSNPAWLLKYVAEFKAEEDSPVGVVYCLYDGLYYYRLHATKTNKIIFYDKIDGNKIVAGDELYDLLIKDAVEITALKI